MTEAHKKLVEWFEWSGMKQGEFAIALGRSESMVSCILKGKRNPGLDLMRAIERVTSEPHREKGTRWRRSKVAASDWLPTA